MFNEKILQLSIRQLQTESARALSHYRETNTSMHTLNKQTHHDSHQFYKLVIQKYMDEFGDLPSLVGPGTLVKLVYEE